MKSTRVLLWITLAGLGSLAACGGVSDIGSGDPGKAGSVGTAVGGSKGTGANGTGASSMGATSNVAGKGPGTGTSGGGFPVELCESDMDCGAAPCAICADGSYACDKTYCAEGKCVHVTDTCPTECATAMECPVPDIACTTCMDGTKACPSAQCLNGKCQTSIPGCGTIDPCQGLPCGSACKSCGPDGACDVMYASHCSADGKCQPGLPQCANANACKTSMDCGTPPPECVPCGNDTCATFDCIQNSCVFACPANPNPQCKVTEDCPAREVCKMCPSGKCAVEACLKNSCELVCTL